jgi:hypothetical protein
MNGYLLVNDDSQEAQDDHVMSFVGGFPSLPADRELPTCARCGATLTFFFQVTFPSDHFWSGYTMAMFACTSCAHEDYAIPEMLPGPLRGAVIPKGFLETYQRNFAVVVFDSRDGVLRHDYTQKIRFRAWKLVPASNPGEAHDKVGGEPSWFLDDEAPSSYDGKPMSFLMQLGEGLRFDILPTAPPQVVLDLRFEPEPSPDPWYSLFLQNYLYFFGTCDRDNPHVYILTQID